MSITNEAGEECGLKEAERFLKTYYDEYQFKEVNSQEFIKFTKYYFNIKDDSVFEEWLQIE
ncbi:hypothetical protein UACE39S_02411 [Ureibacillus acetophenoni]